MYREGRIAPGYELTPAQEERLEKLKRGELHLWDVTPGFEWTPEMKEEARKREEATKSGVKIWDETPGYEFDMQDLKDVPSWFLDGTHSVPPWTPGFSFHWNSTCAHGLRVAAAGLSIPTCKGWEQRTFRGGSYCAFLIVKDPEEMKQREAKFKKALRPYIEDFDGIWKASQDEMMAIYKPLRELDLDAATNHQLLYHMYDLIAMYRRMYEIHFFGMYASYNAWLLLEALCKEWWGITDQSPEFQKLMIGFDNKSFQVDRDLWQFGVKAREKGLADIFMGNEAKDVISKLEQIEAGRQWLKEFREWLWVNGWRLPRICDFIEPIWIEDPTPAIADIKGYMAKGGDFILDAVRERLAKEREEAIAAMMERVPEEQKEWFLALIRLGGKASSYSEEHEYWLDQYSAALIRRGFLGIGERLVQAGTIDRPDDTFFLHPLEIERVIDVPEMHDLRHITNRRRKEWEEWQKSPNPPVITLRDSLEEAVGKDILPSMDAVASKIVVGEMPTVRPELKADLYGLAGSPGVAEGPARVILDLKQLHEVQEGDILVAPNTSPTWTPAFQLIKGAVVDRGGTLAHAPIVGREYGIPVVVNCFVGTTKIKTGDWIRVNGTEGTVYILKR